MIVYANILEEDDQSLFIGGILVGDLSMALLWLYAARL